MAKADAMANLREVFGLAAVWVILVGTAPRPRAEPPANGAVDAAALVRQVREAEAWVARAKSLRLTAESTWSPPDAGVGQPLPAGWTPPPEVVVMGFDDHRMYSRREQKNYRLTHQTWDGRMQVTHSAYGPEGPKVANEEQYVLHKDGGLMGEFFIGTLSWPRAGPHKYWWTKPPPTSADEYYGGAPEAFRVTGRERFRGVDCQVLESDVQYTTWYVGVADARLYAIATRRPAKWAQNSREGIAREVATALAKREFKSRAEQNAWDVGLGEAERAAYQRELSRRLRPFTAPDVLHWFGEYKEVAAGCWMPTHYGYDLWEPANDPTAEPKVRATREIRVREVVVDRPLPDDWFAWELKEGVQVADRRSEPMLVYKYKKHFTPTEWQDVLEDAAQRTARVRPENASIEAQISRPQVLGKAAPEFPEGLTWVNGGPLKMSDLRGKVVVVELFGAWSKFSRDELPKVNELHARSAAEGIVVIGVHSAGTPVEDVRAWAKANGVTFPICVDGPVDKGPWDGELFNAYHVIYMPTAYVVNREGRVVSEGTPGGAVNGARRATTQPSKPARAVGQ
jgi:peroxiredoxin